MTDRPIVRRWNAFFFAPQSPAPVALYRILYGALNVASILLMRHDWLTWFGPRGAITPATVPLAITPILARETPALSVLTLLPQSDAAVVGFYWVFLVAAICLTLGFRTRLSSIVVYACLMSIQARNPFITNGGDWLLRVTGFFLIFAPAGAAFSIDRLIRICRGREGADVAPRSPWAQRMIQIQVAVMYLTTVWWKLLGTTWINGTAVHYALGRADVRRFPLPDLTSIALVRLATWTPLVVEFSAGTAIWFRRLRYPVLAAAVLLHLGIEYTFNVPLFEWIAIAALVTFVYPEDLTRVADWFRTRLSARPTVAMPNAPHGIAAASAPIDY